MAITQSRAMTPQERRDAIAETSREHKLTKAFRKLCEKDQIELVELAEAWVRITR